MVKEKMVGRGRGRGRDRVIWRRTRRGGVVEGGTGTHRFHILRYLRISSINRHRHHMASTPISRHHRCLHRKSTPTGSMPLALEVEVSRGGGEGGNNPLSRSRIRLLISGQGTGIHSVKSALMSRKNTKLLWVKVLLLILPRRITYMLSSLTVLRSVTLVQHALARRCVSSIEDLNM